MSLYKQRNKSITLVTYVPPGVILEFTPNDDDGMTPRQRIFKDLLDYHHQQGNQSFENSYRYL